MDEKIAQLRLLPSDDAVGLVVRRPEDQWLDRTSAKSDARHIADMMVGFANAEGGIIAIGVHSGRIEGVRRVGASRMNDWRQAAIDFTQPPVRHRFECMPCVNDEGEADEIAVIEVEASERVHTNAKGQVYLRVGDENRRLGAREVQELFYDKGESTFDGAVVRDGKLVELDSDLVDRYVHSVRARGAVDEVLIARGLAVAQGSVIQPTTAGLLVLGKTPQVVLPEALVRLLRYRGSSRETGTRANVVADRRIEGGVVNQINAARRILRRWIPRAIRLGDEGRFVTTTLIPEFVWLEALVNAVTHRSYSLGGDHVRLEVFDDRVEVTSPGRLPGLVRLENIRSTRFARNPRIARALSDLGYGRELGEGVNRMFEEMSRAGLPDPVYEQGPSSVRVILLADPLARRILDRLPTGSERFIEYLSRMSRVTTTEAVDLLGLSRPTVLRHLQQLAEHGLIEHVGTSLKDPRGYWRVRQTGPSA